MRIATPVKVVIFYIYRMDNWFAREQAGRDASRRRGGRIAISELGKGGCGSPNSDGSPMPALGDDKFTEDCTAQLQSFLKHRIEHRGEVAG